MLAVNQIQPRRYDHQDADYGEKVGYFAKAEIAERLRSPIRYTQAVRAGFVGTRAVAFISRVYPVRTAIPMPMING